MAGQMVGEWPNYLVWMLLGWVAQGRVVARKMGNSCGTCVVLLGGENGWDRVQHVGRGTHACVRYLPMLQGGVAFKYMGSRGLLDWDRFWWLRRWCWQWYVPGSVRWPFGALTACGWGFGWWWWQGVSSGFHNCCLCKWWTMFLGGCVWLAVGGLLHKCRCYWFGLLRVGRSWGKSCWDGSVEWRCGSDGVDVTGTEVVDGGVFWHSFRVWRLWRAWSVPIFPTASFACNYKQMHKQPVSFNLINFKTPTHHFPQCHSKLFALISLRVHPSTQPNQFPTSIPAQTPCHSSPNPMTACSYKGIYPTWSSVWK